MKRIFIVAIAFICCLVSGRALAQDVQTATLQHGDELQVFYGPQAFVEAYSNAEDGDGITLSAGTFQTFNLWINKVISIHGAGFVNDVDNNRNRTVIEGGALTFSILDEKTGCLIEGIYCKKIFLINSKGVTINACLIEEIQFGSDSVTLGEFTENCLITNSRIFSIRFARGTDMNLCLFNNIIGTMTGNDSASTLSVDHCIIASSGSYKLSSSSVGSYDSHQGNVYGVFTNSIINYPTPNTICSAFNNIVIGQNFKTINQDKNILMSLEEANDLFISSKLGDEADIENMDFKLKKVPLIGTDFTEVGIHGGLVPFNDIPGIPQIISKEIAPRSDAEGKLSVKIKVQTN